MTILDARIDNATRFFIKLNAFLAAQKILAVDERVNLPEVLLADAWSTLYDLAGYARPTERWTGR